MHKEYTLEQDNYPSLAKIEEDQYGQSHLTSCANISPIKFNLQCNLFWLLMRPNDPTCEVLEVTT